VTPDPIGAGPVAEPVVSGYAPGEEPFGPVDTVDGLFPVEPAPDASPSPTEPLEAKPPPEIVEEVLAVVARLRGPEVDDELRGRGQATDGNVETRKQRLVKMMIRERTEHVDQ